MFNQIGPLEIAVVLVIVLLIFGPKRLPGLGKSLGTGMREFKDSITGKDTDGDDAPAQQEPATLAQAQQPQAAAPAPVAPAQPAPAPAREPEQPAATAEPRS
jgi:sec-independent protein translocase protein TatA